MKFNQLKALLAIADAGSIHEAARLLHLTQSALSKSIKELEREVGTELLVRSAKGATLTECGLMMIRRSRSIEKEMGRMWEEIGSYRGEVGGRLTIGHTGPAATLALAEAVADFVKKRPMVKVSVLEMRGGQIAEGLRNGTLDLGLVSQYGEPDTDLCWRKMLSHETMLVSGPRENPETTLEALIDEPWLTLDPEDDAESCISTLFAHYGLTPPSRIMRSSSVTLYIQLAVRINAVMHWMDAVRPSFARYFEQGTMTRLVLPHDMPKLNIFLQYRDQDLLTASAVEFVDLYERGCARWAGRTEESFLKLEMAA